MIAEALVRASVEGGLLAACLWIVLKLFPAIRPSARVWLWRLVYIKFVLSALPLGPIDLYVLDPKSASAQPVAFSTPGRPAKNPAVQANGTRAETAPESGSWSGEDVATFVWICCFAGLLGAGALSIAVSRSALRGAILIPSGPVVELLDDLAEKANLPRRPLLYASSKTQTALLAAGFPSKIVLPEAMFASGDVYDLRMTLAHELSHEARKDLWWDLGARVVQSAFFFHPLIWLASQELDLARESAADEMALEITGASARRYADMLYRATVQLPRVSPLALATEPGVFGILRSRHALQRRLKAMKHFSRKPTLAKNAMSFALLALCSLALPAYRFLPMHWQQEFTLGGAHLRSVELATMMYTQDYDDVLPAVQTTHAVQFVTFPYTKSAEIWKTANPKGDQFQFSMNVAGVAMTTFPELAKTVEYHESETWPDGNRWVGYADGHVKKASSDLWDLLKPTLKTKYPRKGGLLPADYGAKWNPPTRATPASVPGMPAGG
jgi:beta-lactamase regulating signal transducer with metallopeptidase domain